MTNPALGYEGYMVPTLFGPWAARLIQPADPRKGERILDVGCGTGIVARQVASRLGAGSTVTGLDLSPNMLAVAKSAAIREGVAIEWHEGSASHLPFPDDSFDLVLCQFALMFFADKSAALAEMRRVVTQEGRVFLSVWQGLERHPFYQVLHEVIERRVGISAIEEIFALGHAEELRKLVLESGFSAVTVEPVSMTSRFPSPDGFLAGEIEVDTAAIPSMQRLDEPARKAITAAIAEDMKAPLAAMTHDNHVVIEFHANIIRAWP